MFASWFERRGQESSTHNRGVELSTGSQNGCSVVTIARWDGDLGCKPMVTRVTGPTVIAQWLSITQNRPFIRIMVGINERIAPKLHSLVRLRIRPLKSLGCWTQSTHEISVILVSCIINIVISLFHLADNGIAHWPVGFITTQLITRPA